MSLTLCSSASGSATDRSVLFAEARAKSTCHFLVYRYKLELPYDELRVVNLKEEINAVN